MKRKSWWTRASRVTVGARRDCVLSGPGEPCKGEGLSAGMSKPCTFTNFRFVRSMVVQLMVAGNLI